MNIRGWHMFGLGALRDDRSWIVKLRALPAQPVDKHISFDPPVEWC
jgi:hypothetical protein